MIAIRRKPEADAIGPIDGDASIRLGARVRTLFQAACWFLLAFGAISAASDGDLVVLVSCVLLSISSLSLCRREYDVAILFLAIHPTLTYAATTAAFSIAHLNLSLTGFVDKDTAFVIVSVYQAAIFSAYLVSRLVSNRSISNDFALPALNKNRASVVTLAGFCIFVLFALTPDSSTLASISGTAIAVMCFGLGSYVTADGMRRIFAPIAVSLIAVGGCALLLNQRTSLFLILLFWIIIILSISKSLFSWRNLLISIAAIFIINLVTFSFVAAREEHSENPDINTISRTIDIALSARGLDAAIPFIDSEPSSRSYSSRTNRYYSNFLGGGPNDSNDVSASSTLARLAQMGAMDIVTGRLGDVNEIDVSRWWQLLISTMPDFGQAKDLRLSDDIVWELGLRDRTSIGRPLVTVAGEMYAIGGFAGLFILASTVFLAIFLELLILRRVIGYSAVYVGTAFSILYGITMTGTALSAIAVATRALPQIIIVLWLAALYLRRRHLPPLTATTSRVDSSSLT